MIRRWLVIATFVCVTLTGTESRDSFDPDHLTRQIADPIRELISVLTQHSIVIDRLQDNDALHTEIQAAIVQALNSDIRVTSMDEMAGDGLSTASEPESEYHLLAIDADVVYVRIGKLTSDIVAHVERELLAHCDQPLFVIWDFRYSHNFDREPVLSFEQCIDQLPNASFIALVNEQTVGSFEVMAKILQARNGCVIIGVTTAGQPYSYRQAKLSSGATLLIPNERYALNNGTVVSNEPCVPTIFLQNDGDYAQLKSRLRDIDRICTDDSVVYAIDLVKAHRLMGKRRFQ